MVEKNYDYLDVDFEDENLKIEKDEKVFIVSIHNPTSQIWLSSPISGAHHFELINNTNDWIGTRDKNLNLIKVLETGIGFVKVSEKLLKLFKVDNYFRLLIIFTVFGITGSLSVVIRKIFINKYFFFKYFK